MAKISPFPSGLDKQKETVNTKKNASTFSLEETDRFVNVSVSTQPRSHD